MKISCPNCATRFTVADSALGTAGRKIKCVKCGYIWHQNPPSATPAPAPAPRPAPQPAPEPAPPPVAAPPPEPAPEPQVSDDVREIRDILGMNEDMESTGDGSFSMDGGIPMDSGEVPLEMPAPGSAPPPAAKREGDFEAPLDMDDFGDIFKSSAEVPEEHKNVDQMLSEHDPEPIPDVFSAPSSFAQKKKKGKGGVIFFVFLLLIGGILGGGWFFRDKVLHYVPQAAPAYAFIDGLGWFKKDPGEGLKFNKVADPEGIRKGDIIVLVVKGEILNMTGTRRNLPYLKLTTLNGDGKPVQTVTSPPPQATIEGGDSVSFILTIEPFSKEGRNYELAFVDPPVDGQAAPENPPETPPETPMDNPPETPPMDNPPETVPPPPAQ